MATIWPLRTIGPTIPSMFLDKRLEDDKAYGLSIFKSNTDACMKWLNDHPKGSVVYVSFGSFAELKVEQMEELAWGLKMSNMSFLWVVRALEEEKLPKTFVEETSEKGLIVHWCPQLEVLLNHNLSQKFNNLIEMNEFNYLIYILIHILIVMSGE
jgi:pathogen-inducible salicylic acid glucosyltransferase